MLDCQCSHRDVATMRKQRRLVGLLLALSTVVLLLAACRGGSDSTAVASPTPTPTAESIMDAARQRFSEINSAHFLLTVDGDAYLDSTRTLALRGAEGDLARPDRANVNASVALAGATINIALIAVGDEQYITNPLTGQWQQAPEGLSFNPAILFDPQQGIPSMLAEAQDLTLVGTEKLNGTDTYHLRGAEPRSAVAPLTGGGFQGDAIDFDIWITRNTHDIAQIVLHDTAVVQGTTPPTWTLAISNQNAPVTITPPAG